MLVNDADFFLAGFQNITNFQAGENWLQSNTNRVTEALWLFPCIIRGFLIYERKKGQDFRKTVAALICSIDFAGSVTGDKCVDRFVDRDINQF